MTSNCHSIIARRPQYWMLDAGCWMCGQGELCAEETPNIEQGIMNIEEDDGYAGRELCVGDGYWMLDTGCAGRGNCV